MPTELFYILMDNKLEQNEKNFEAVGCSSVKLRMEPDFRKCEKGKTNFVQSKMWTLHSIINVLFAQFIEFIVIYQSDSVLLFLITELICL